jgi:hypothetical protein
MAQVGRSGLTGTFLDKSGAAVPRVKVNVRNEATNLLWTTVASESGAYFVQNLPVGQYTLSAEAGGFQKAVVEHIQTEVDKVTSVDVTLTLGEVTQSVEVQAESGMLTTTSATVGNLVTRKEIETLPLNGRSWMTLNYLTPSAVKFRGSSAANSDITASVSPGNFVVNGLRGGNNKFFIDGVSLENTEDQILGILPPIESLQEFRTQSSNVTAEFISGAGAMVSATTKSGTNQLHGSVWEYLRNSALDARSFFDSAVPPFRRNQFGVAAGGPIIKDRTFVFGSYEGFRQRKSTTAVGDYPTAAQRSGDLSSLSSAVIDPLSGAPFPGSRIPASRINPLSAAWLEKYIPVANLNVPVGQGNFVKQVPRPIDYDTYIGRVDHRFTDRTSIFGRYIYTKTTSLQRFIAPASFYRPQTRPNHNVAFTYTRSINPSTLLEARFGYHRWFHNEPVAADGDPNMLTELGVLGKPGFTDVADSQLAPPRISVTGFAQFGHGFFGRPRQYGNDHFYYDGLLFKTKGSHSMKMGGGVIRSRADFPEIINPTGSWTYNGQFSTVGLGDFLLGFPRSVSTSIDEFSQKDQRLAGNVWFQDDWKVTPRLVLNLGFRVDIDGRFESSNGKITNMDLSKPPIVTLITPDDPNFPRPDGWARRLFDAPSYDYAPRVGLAYRFLSNSVVRAGYGIYWQQMGSDPPVNISIQAPWIRNIGATYDVTDLPNFDRTNPFRSTVATGSAGYAIQKNFQDAYVQQWNFTLEHTIGANLFAASYVGNKGTHLTSFPQPNLAPPGPGAINPRRPYTTAVSSTGVVIGAMGGIQYHESSRDSSYNALQLKLQRRFSKNLSFTASYAWGKAINTADGTYIESRSDAFQQPRNAVAERGLAEFDVRHSLTFSYIYAIPIGSGMPAAAAKIFGGWQLLGITRLLTGSPFTVTNGFDNLNNGGTGYPDLVCNPNYSGDRSNAQKTAAFFNTACFARPPLYQYGNQGRNVLIGPGTQLWDTGLQKEFPFSERYKLEFKAEFFNVFNNVNFGYPNASFGTPQFATIRSTSEDPRSMQFGLKFSF